MYTDCKKCPACLEERQYTADSFEFEFKVMCRHMDKRIVMNYCDWHEEAKTPEWCPLKNKQKVYIVLVGQDDKDIDTGHATIESANKSVIDIAGAWGAKILYDNRGCAYSDNGDCWICEVEIENNI